MSSTKFLTNNQKEMFLAMFEAVIEDVEDERKKERNELILKEMRKHEGDFEKYALYGYLTAMIMKDIIESMNEEEEEEYRIIG